MRYITSVSWFVKSRQLIDWRIYSLCLTDSTWLRKENLLIVVIALSFWGDSGAGLIFPLLLMSPILCLLITGHFAQQCIYRQVRYTSCVNKGNYVIYIFHNSAMPFVLGHDRKSGFTLNWKISMSWARWLLTSGNREWERFPTVLIPLGYDLLWSNSLKNLTPRRLTFSLNTGHFTDCVLRSSRLPDCHGVDALCQCLYILLFIHGSQGAGVVKVFW